MPKFQPSAEVVAMLPPDYADLTKAGQKKARLAVVCNESTPEAAVQGWKFFREVYLRNEEASGYRYYRRWAPSPAFHAHIVEDFYRYPLTVLAAPRGFAKSTVVSEEFPVKRALVRPGTRTTIINATLSLCKERMENIKPLFETNELIRHDFGELKPAKGKGLWTQQTISLSNGSRISFFPTEGKKRGVRPDAIIIDDAEWDPKNEVSAARLKGEFERLLFKVILPMADEGVPVFWIGTVADAQLYIWTALRAVDPRFKLWHSHHLKAEWTDDAGRRQLLWPEKKTAKFLDRQRAVLGPSAYASEFLNSPATDEDKILRPDEVLDTYVIDGEWSNPWTSNAMLKYYLVPRGETEGVPRRVKLCDFLPKVYIFATIDVARTIGPMSDFAVVHIMAFDSDDTLWSLDCWAGKVRDVGLIERIRILGHLWRPRVVGVEWVPIQDKIYQRVRAEGEKWLDWKPRILPIKYPPGVEKTDRIEDLEWRFRFHKIKYPAESDRIQNPAYRMLWHQTRNFTPGLGLLDHDDVIDTAAMAQYVKRGKPTLARAEAGRLARPHPAGIHPGSGINASELTMQEIDELMDEAYRAEQEYDPPALSEVMVIPPA